MSATSGGGGSVSEGSDAGGSSQSTMSVSDSPSTSFQANLVAENVTKITLSEENGSGGYVADMTGSKINLTLDERQQKDGIVNVAFDYEEAANRGGGGGGGGSGAEEFRSMNGSEKKDKVPEAVNLELVNMVPYSNGNGTNYGVPVNGIPGIPMKKDSEQVDMSTPYDEYFVPVNEHKKYMRGEKLYVTKDKRRPTSWRRCLSWIVACTVISVVLILAILAGTGVILSQEPDLVKDASVGRNFAGSNLKPSVTDKSPTPTAEKLMFVPRSIESEFVIDNLNFDPAFKDINSSAYQQFKSNMEDQLKMLLFDKETLEFGASDIGIKVVNISRDPFKVNYRIGWNYKQGVNNPPEPIKMEDVKRRLVESLARNQAYIDKYHIDRESIKVNHVINACQVENGGCSHICYYNYLTQLFTCTCPTHLVLDATGKNCVAWSGSSEDDAVPIPSHAIYPGMPYESTSNPAQEFEYTSNFQHGVHQSVHHQHESDFEHSTDSTYGGRNDQQHPDHEPAPERIPEPTAEPDPSQKDKSSNNFEVLPEPTPEPNVKEGHHEGLDGDMHSDNVNSQYEHGRQIIHASGDVSDSQVFPEPTPEPTVDDKYHDHAYSVYESEEPGSESSAGKNNAASVHSSYASRDQEPTAEPTPEPSPEGGAHDHVVHSVYDSRNHESAAETSAEPSPEPTAEPNTNDKVHGVHSVGGFKDHEPAAEPAPEPEPSPEPTAEPNTNDKVHAVHSITDFKDHEPVAEPTPEPSPEPTAESSASDKSSAGYSVNDFKDHEPAAEPTPEPSPEPAPEPVPGGDDHDHNIHSVYDSKSHEPAAEPTPEPNPGSNFHGHIIQSAYDSKNPEPAVEPTLEPALEPTAEPDSKTQEHNVHPLHESGDHELVTETTLGSGQQGQHKEHDTHSSKNNEPIDEPTPEPSLEEQNREYGVHSVHETKDVPEGTTVSTFTNGNQAAEQSPELAPKPTPEPSAGDDGLIHSLNPETNEHLGPNEEQQTHLLLSKDQMNLGVNSSPNDSKQQPVEEQMQVTDFKTEHPNGAHSEGQNEPDKDNKSKHQVPYLQDILIRAPNSDSEKENATIHGENVLHNVELTENGEPVIEEVLIDKPRKMNESETSSPAITSNTHVDSEANRSNPVVGEGSDDVKSAVTRSPDSTSGSVLMTGSSDGAREIKTELPEIVDGATTGHKSVDQSTVQQSARDGNETNHGNLEYTETPTNNGESTIIITNQEPTHHSDTEADHYGVDERPLNANRGIDQQDKSVDLPQNKVSDSTIQPEIQHEHRTIPEAVDILSSSERDINIDGKPKHDSKAESDEPHTTEKIITGRGEGPAATGTNGSLMLNGAGLYQTKSHEITTESQIATTMLLSVLSPDAIDEKVGVDQLPNKGKEEKEAGLREAVTEDKAVNKPGHLEDNETTKSPEEFSNNIKDELLDNEEFNALLGKEHKKETGSNEGKDLLNKYPSKSQKIDKKKIKDYFKGEKLDSDKKTEVTARPAVTPEDFILQKHVNGNENTFDLDYSLQNEHTTKHDGEVTVIDPHGFDVVPGVSFKPHGINNHDLKVLQTVAPDSTSETGHTQELEAQKYDSKVKLPDSREGDKQDKDYTKFDKDYKYEKQKVSKKKDLKKKGGSGKDGKNVELDDGRKYFGETSKENTETSHEIVKDTPETVSPFEKVTLQPETGVRLLSGSVGETTAIPEYKGKIETTFQPSHTNTLEKRTEVAEDVTEYTGQIKPVSEETDSTAFGKPPVRLHDNDHHGSPVDQNYHQMIDEPSVKTTSSVSTETVYDGQFGSSVNSTDLSAGHMTKDSSGPFTGTESSGLTAKNGNVTPGTVFDRISVGTISQSSASGSGTVLYEAGTSSAIPKIVNEGATPQSGIANTTAANPTIIIHGQSGSLQDGHILRFANATFHGPGNATVISVLNGTLGHSDGQTFTFRNYTTTFPNGSTVQPTIIVRGQSGTLQDGHEIRFGNATLVTSLPTAEKVVRNSTVYRIENGSLPGTVFDGHFNPQNGHYHMFSNSSGTFVYSNVTDPPTFIIRGESGDFGNSRAYIMANDSGSRFSGDFTRPSVIFRNSTVFAVGNTQGAGRDAQGVDFQEITAQPADLTSNETIHYTRQMSPNFFSTGTAYKVNNYFGYISKCASGQFQCVNGTSKRGSACISLSSKCDSINDCSDGSDELGCIENGCPGNFQCSDGNCLKRNLVCNGILDCSDGSDEKQCESWECEFDEFQCPSGRCIPVVWQCDGKPDCDNHTDEYHCQTSCGNDEYLCPEGWCVPLTYRCNGVKECSMGEDEQLCDCSHEEFKCQTGGCVSSKQICDGLDDCPDRSDEWDCVKLEPGSNLLKIRSASGDFEPVCADGWTSKNSDEVCASLGYYSSVPTENSSSISTETSFFTLKNGSTDNFNKKVIVNLKKSEGNCSSGKLVAVSCQEFSCGSRSMTDSSSVEARLVGGMSAAAGQWPSVALLYNVRNFHSCTANVLTPRWVLASYNCLKMGNKNLNEQDWKFFGGSTVFEAERENAETRNIVSIIPHPQVKFNQFLFSNDLALVELDQSLHFTSNLGAVCLPEREMQPRQICVTAGWGMNTPEDKTIRQQLQYLPVPTMNLTECNSTEHYSGFITEDKICAGYNSAQKSLCYNEEGAPLMCVNDRGEWELQGVLSYHSNCGRGSHPSIFNSITPVADWIKKTIGNSFERKSVAVTKR